LGKEGTYLSKEIMKKKIQFFTEGIKFRIREKSKIRSWVKETIECEGYEQGNLNIVLCNAQYLQGLNHKYLKSKLLTDILTFNFSENNQEIDGEIYISVDRVRENAQLFRQTMKEELNRVIIHGVLHLMGYNDHKEAEVVIMRKKEDFYLEEIKRK